MIEICKNCQCQITSNYCSHCGEKKYTRIDRQYIINELQFILLRTNKGFFYSIKKILRNPGKTAREYIAGQRINHYKPVLLAMLLGGVSTYITFKILHMDQIASTLNKEQYIEGTDAELNRYILDKIIEFISYYNSILTLAFIPIVSIFSYYLFKKWGYNYYEQIVANIFFYIYSVLIDILLTPIRYLFTYHVNLINTYSNIIYVINAILLFWFYKELFPWRKNKHILVPTLLYILVLVLTFYIAIIVFSIIMTMQYDSIST